MHILKDAQNHLSNPNQPPRQEIKDILHRTIQQSTFLSLKLAKFFLFNLHWQINKINISSTISSCHYTIGILLTRYHLDINEFCWEGTEVTLDLGLGFLLDFWYLGECCFGLESGFYLVAWQELELECSVELVFEDGEHVGVTVETIDSKHTIPDIFLIIKYLRHHLSLTIQPQQINPKKQRIKPNHSKIKQKQHILFKIRHNNNLILLSNNFLLKPSWFPTSKKTILFVLYIFYQLNTYSCYILRYVWYWIAI